MFVEVLATPKDIVQHEQSATEKIARCEECTKRRMENENTAACKSAT